MFVPSVAAAELPAFSDTNHSVSSVFGSCLKLDLDLIPNSRPQPLDSKTPYKPVLLLQILQYYRHSLLVS